MRESIRLGTVSRIRVGLNWSVAVIVALIAVLLATNVFRAVRHRDSAPTSTGSWRW